LGRPVIVSSDRLTRRFAWGRTPEFRLGPFHRAPALEEGPGRRKKLGGTTAQPPPIRGGLRPEEQARSLRKAAPSGGRCSEPSPRRSSVPPMPPTEPASPPPVARRLARHRPKSLERSASASAMGRFGLGGGFAVACRRAFSCCGFVDRAKGGSVPATNGVVYLGGNARAPAGIAGRPMDGRAPPGEID